MRTRTIRAWRGLVAVTAVMATGFGAAACTSDQSVASDPAIDTDEAPGTTVPPSTTGPADPRDTDHEGRGWIGGEPDWGADEFVDGADDSSAAADEFEAGSGSERPASPDAGLDRVAGDVAAEVDRPTGDPVDATGGPLRAGSVDDNEDITAFGTYIDRVTDLGIVGRQLDLTGRIIVRVVDERGASVPGVEVEVAGLAAGGGSASAITRTTADGTVRFFPSVHGFDPAEPVELRMSGGADAIAADPGSEVTLTASAVAVVEPVPLDVLFLLDATGSMADEIDRLTATIDLVAEQVNGLEPRPDVRFAMTLYRDEGDSFLTSTYDFTTDVDAFRSALSDVVAEGGGDYAEALDEGLADALSVPEWRAPSDAVQLLFLVADAPPQVTRDVGTPYTASIVDAVGRGIKIFPIASSEADDLAELVFRQLAVTTGAPFVFLSYGAATGESTDIERTDYEELALDQLVVRLIAEELADLPDAAEVTVPSTTAPSTTIPDEQQQPTTSSLPTTELPTTTTSAPSSTSTAPDPSASSTTVDG